MLSICNPLIFETQVINEALFLLFALLVAGALAAVLSGALKSLAVNIFFINNDVSLHNNIRTTKIT